MSILLQFKDLPVQQPETIDTSGKFRIKAREIVSAWADHEFGRRLAPSPIGQTSLLMFEMPRFANQNFAKQCALEGFNQGAFSLEVNGTKARDLDEEFALDPEAPIRFLIPKPILAG